MSSSTLPSERSPFYPGWRVLFASVVGLAFSPGPMIFGSLGLFAPHLHGAFGWGRGQIMLSLTFFNIAGVLASPYTGKLIDRLGVRRVLFPSLTALLAGFLAMAWLTRTLAEFYGLAFIWGALTVGTQSISYTKLITGWFVRQRGLAVGVAAAGLGLGYSLTPLIVGQLLSVMGWREALSALALIVAVAPMLVNTLLARPRPDLAGQTALEQAGLTLAQARRTPEFRYMAGAILLASAALTGVVPHIALLTLDRGFSTAQAATVASAYGVSTILGRIVVGALADRYFVARVAIAFFALSGVGFLAAGAFGAGASLGVLILVALTIGLGFGAESDVIALFIARFFGQRHFAAIYGALLAVFLIGAASGPALFGYGRDLMGGYQGPMFIAAAIMLGACALLARLRPKSDGQIQDQFTDATARASL